MNLKNKMNDFSIRCPMCNNDTNIKVSIAMPYVTFICSKCDYAKTKKSSYN